MQRPTKLADGEPRILSGQDWGVSGTLVFETDVSGVSGLSPAGVVYARHRERIVARCGAGESVVSSMAHLRGQYCLLQSVVDSWCRRCVSHGNRARASGRCGAVNRKRRSPGWTVVPHPGSRTPGRERHALNVPDASS